MGGVTPGAETTGEGTAVIGATGSGTAVAGTVVAGTPGGGTAAAGTAVAGTPTAVRPETTPYVPTAPQFVAGIPHVCEILLGFTRTAQSPRYWGPEAVSRAAGLRNQA